jgi:hypothetical protein
MSGNSNGDPKAQSKIFKPTASVAAKMQPVSRDSFMGLLKRAANSPALKLSPRAK